MSSETRITPEHNKGQGIVKKGGGSFIKRKKGTHFNKNGHTYN